MALFYVLQKISIPNYPAKFFWVNVMPFVNVNVDSYLRCGSRLKNEVNLHVSLCLSSVFIFIPCFWNLRRIGRALLVLGSRLKNEVKSNARFLCFSSKFIFTHCFWNSVYWQGTVSSRLTLKERGMHTRFTVFLLHVYFHWWILKFGVMAGYC